MSDLTITEAIDTTYKQYAMYTLEERAIPSIMDGFKPVQRKLWYLMKSQNEFIKVESLSGKLPDCTNYHHGADNGAHAAIKMSQSFTGSNNIPYFLTKGNFGNQPLPDSYAAPRYIYTKRNKFWDHIFIDNDICPESDDIENPEPLYYLPSIPTILLNGIKGLAVAFSTEIQPYNIKDIKKCIIALIKNKEMPKLLPFYNGFRGKIEEENEKIVMKGVYEIINSTTLRITEMPVGVKKDKYLEYLIKLIDDGEILDYVDSSDGKWDITIKLKRNSDLWDNIEKKFKLNCFLNNNLTVLDENKKIRVFSDVYELIKYWYNARIKFYTKKKEFEILKRKNKILYLSSKITYIKWCINELSKKSKIEKLDLDNFIQTLGDDCSYLKSIPIYNMTTEEIENLESQLPILNSEIAHFESIGELELLLDDLNKI